MCLVLIAPFRKIALNYVAESIRPRNGGSIDVLDVLLENPEDDDLDRVHILYPFPLPMPPAAGAEPIFNRIQNKKGIQLLTPSLKDRNHELNRWYSLCIDEKYTGVGTWVNLILSDPTRGPVTVSGVVREDQVLLPFTPVQRDGTEKPISVEEWRLLNRLRENGWSIFTLKFNDPIKKSEARWIRLCTVTGRHRRNEMGSVEELFRYMTGFLIHYFTIFGPIDVRQQLWESVLRERNQQKAAFGGLEEKINLLGLRDGKTVVHFRDWRITVTSIDYRKITDVKEFHDVIADGSDRYADRFGCGEYLYFWRAGPENVIPQKQDGKFRIAFQAHNIPSIVIALPWIALTIAISRPYWPTVRGWIDSGLVAAFMRMLN